MLRAQPRNRPANRLQNQGDVNYRGETGVGSRIGGPAGQRHAYCRLPRCELTEWQLRWKMTAQLLFAETRAYADQVLGRTRIDTDSAPGKYALRRQYLLRRSAPRRQDLHF